MYFGKVEPPDGQVLRYVTGGEPESLDPQVGTGQPEARIYVALFEGLTDYDPKTGDVAPGLAERWEAAEGNTVFMFHLREAHPGPTAARSRPTTSSTRCGAACRRRSPPTTPIWRTESCTRRATTAVARSRAIRTASS